MTSSSSSVPEPVHEARSVLTSPETHAVDPELTETESFILEMLQRLDEADSEAAHLRRALEHSRDIGAAVGVLMALKKVTRDEAFDLLRRASQDQNRKVSDLALDVLSEGQLPGQAS
jgi:AmiR/NasT family two-component response regulator